MKDLSRYTIIALGFSLFIILIILPISSLLRFAFEDGPGAFIRAVTDEDAIQAFSNSLFIAVLCTFVNLLVGTLLAFAITRYDFLGRTTLKALIDLPIAIPTAVVGLSLMMLYGPNGLLGPLMEKNGIEIVMALPGVVLGHVFVTFPYMVRSVSVVLEMIDRNLEDAARCLGANRIRTFIHVTLPCISSGIIAGSALTFTRSLGEFGATLFIAGGMIKTGPLFIYELSEARFDLQAASSVSIVLMGRELTPPARSP